MKSVDSDPTARARRSGKTTRLRSGDTDADDLIVRNHGTPTAGSGAVFDLSSNRLRPDGWTSADAAGLPILAGLVRFDELKAGSIAHAIRFTAQCTRNRHVWPARHDAGTSDQRCPPMGARFRLKAGFDVTGFTPRPGSCSGR
jgi:hypothetical protein